MVISISFSGCDGEQKITPEPLQSSVTTESLREEPVNLSSANLKLASEETIPEINLVSFSSVYVKDNNNKNLRPLFNWDNVPGNESRILRDYIKKWGPTYSWVENAHIIKTNEFLFTWDEVPGESSIKIIEILLRNYGIEWVPNEKIEKSDDGRKLEIYIGNRHIVLTLNNEKTRAIVEIDQVKTEEFIVKEEDHKLNIYSSDNNSISIGDTILISLISSKSAFMRLGGGGIEFPVQEKNGTYIVYDVNSFYSHNISERRYAAYNLSIKNNGSSYLGFNLDKLHLLAGNQMLDVTTMEWLGLPGSNEETKIEDITLSPGQIINGSVAFRVNSMYDKSFLLMYNTTPVPLASFEKSIEALEKAELFDYTEAVGKPPYHAENLEPPYSPDTYSPPEPEYYSKRNVAYSLIWSNWVNRSVLEFFKKLDLTELNRFNKEDDLPVTSTTYVLKLMPEKNISVLPGNPVVVGDNEEELIRTHYTGIAISVNQTYQHYSENFSHKMDFPNATVVRILFDNIYGWPMASRMNRNDQVVILDDKQNIVAVIYNYAHFVS